MSELSFETRQIQDLRAKVQDVLTSQYDTDFNLLRWLQAFNFEVENAENALRNHLKFRQSSWNLDEMRERNEPVHSYWKWGMLGEGGKGRNEIIYVEQSGKNDIDGYMKTFSILELFRARIFDYERMLRAVMQLEKDTGKQAYILFVMDLDGLKFDSSLLSIIKGPLKAITNVMAEQYPELFSHFVVINAPSWFYQVWCIFKPLMPARLPNKVKVLSSNWRQEMLEFADPKILPSRWDQENKDSQFGGDLERPVKVPESLYSMNTNLLSNNIQTVTVSAGKFEFLNIKIEKPGTVLKFGAHAYCGEFGFGIFFSQDENETDASKMEMVYPQFTKCVGPSFVPLTDQLLCAKSGHYKLWLSNLHAWWSNAKFEYFIETC